MAISEFTVATANTNAWAPVETSAVGGSKKYGIYVTNASNPRYTFANFNFYPSSKSLNFMQIQKDLVREILILILAPYMMA